MYDAVQSMVPIPPGFKKIYGRNSPNLNSW